MHPRRALPWTVTVDDDLQHPPEEFGVPGSGRRGLQPQPAAPDNPHQLHRSGWSAAEMRARGYDVTGIGGWRPLRGVYALPRFRPHWLTARLARVTERWYEPRPERAFQILCVRTQT